MTTTTNILDTMLEKFIPEDHEEFNAKNSDGLENEEKISACTHQTGCWTSFKMPDGTLKNRPTYCRLCPKCFEREAEEHLSKFDASHQKALADKPNGQWRMKIVEKSTESASLKKRIARNQNSAHMAIDDIGNPGFEQIWSFVEDEVGKDNDAIYGCANNPITINWDAVNRSNKKTGSKVSKGSGLRSGPKIDGKKNTERLMIPGIQPRDKSEEKAIREIMRSTNILEHAKDAKEVQHLILVQMEKILIEAEKEGYTDLIIKNWYYNITEEQMLEDWNGNVDNCLSLYAAIENNVDADMDMINSIRRFYLTPSPQKEEKLAA